MLQKANLIADSEAIELPAAAGVGWTRTNDLGLFSQCGRKRQRNTLGKRTDSTVSRTAQNGPTVLGLDY
jgi:hypothetical protein